MLKASELSHVNSSSVFLKNSKHISLDFKWLQRVPLFCLKLVYLTLHWQHQHRLIISTQRQHSFKVWTMCDQNPRDFSEVSFLFEIRVPPLALAGSCEITDVSSLATFLKNWKHVWSVSKRLQRVKYFLAWNWLTSPCTVGSIRDFSRQFLGSISKKVKTCLISHQVTSESNAFLLETQMRHLALAAPWGITEVCLSAAYPKVSKNVWSDSKWLETFTRFCLKWLHLT